MRRLLLLLSVLSLTVLSLISTEMVGATHPGINGKIAFIVNAAGGEQDVWTANADGSSAVNLTSDPLQPYDDPAWSSDGTKLAYVVYSNTGAVIRIWDSDLDLTTDFLPLGDTNASHPAWSPDGTKLAFVAHPDGDSGGIWISDLNGTNAQFLTTGSNPDWSPDGTRLAFHDYGLHRDVFVVDVDGSNRLNLTNVSLSDLNPSWSPSGDRILFESQRDWSTGFYANYELYSMAVNGSDVHRLTFTTDEVTQGRWSPDGERIVFVAQVDSDPGPSNSLGSMKIYTMAADGTNIQLVSGTDDSYSHSPSWGSGGFVVPDTDGDGVTDADDMCPATSLGDPPEKLKKNRFAADATGLFVDVQGTESGFSVVDAFGCDEDQIIELMNLGAGHNKFGITRSVLLTFISMY